MALQPGRLVELEVDLAVVVRVEVVEEVHRLRVRLVDFFGAHVAAATSCRRRRRTRRRRPRLELASASDVAHSAEKFGDLEDGVVVGALRPAVGARRGLADRAACTCRRRP